MKAQIIKLTYYNADGCNMDATVFAKIYGSGITYSEINQIIEAVDTYRGENQDDWDLEGCVDATQKYLEKEGYKVEWIDPDIQSYI